MFQPSWQQNTPPWQQKSNIAPQSLFPVPPALNSGILGASPRNTNNDRRPAVPSLFATDARGRDYFNQRDTQARNSFDQHNRDNQQYGILGQKPASSNSILQNNLPPWQSQSQSPRQTPNQRNKGPSSLMNPPSPQQQRSNIPPSLFAPTKSGPPSLLQDNNLTRYNPSVSNRFQGNQERKNESPRAKMLPPKPQPSPKPQLQPKPLSQQQQEQEKKSADFKADLEKKALAREVSEEFYNEVWNVRSKPMNQAVKFALQLARSEYNKSKGKPSPDKPIGQGHHVCGTCYVKFLTRNQLTQHYATISHKELEMECNIRKEQARLIIDNKIPRPKKPSPDTTMAALSRAEVEMNLKPTEMELDPYILGIYESIMRPYWPVPKSSFYCRICNYVEFVSQRDLDDHRFTREHVQKEDSYSEAFCLYCQVHTTRPDLMANHEKTEKHKQTKDLMEKTKQCAIKHWHGLNRIPLPPSVAQNEEKVGAKRSAPLADHKLESPVKKPSNVKPIRSPAKRNVVVDLTDDGNSELPKVALKSIMKSNDRVNAALTDKTKMWFAPISGYMCVACHTFIVDEEEQAAHVKEAIHAINVAKFKKMLKDFN